MEGGNVSDRGDARRSGASADGARRGSRLSSGGARHWRRAAMTVNLTRIYTKLGDGGETHLGDMSRVSKLHPRVEAYGTVDELNATIGVALLQPGLPERVRAVAARACRTTCSTSAPTCRCPRRPAREPPASARAPARRRRLHRWLEQACDEVNATLEPLRSFVIPGGTAGGGALHVCRTVCRRAERRAIAVGEEGNPEVVRYLNRLSDLLFILSRAANNEPGAGEHAEPLWQPGAHGAGGERARASPAAALGALGARASRAASARSAGAHAGDRRASPSAAPAGSRRARRWACARRGSAATRRPPARTQRPSDGDAPTARGGATSTAHSASDGRGGRVAAGPRGRADVREPTCTCGCASSGLSSSALSGASAMTSATASATRGRCAGDRDEHERDAPEREQRRVEQVRQDFGDAADAACPSGDEVVVAATASLEVRRRHQLGERPRRPRARPGKARQRQRPGRAGPPTLVGARRPSARAASARRVVYG